MKKAKQLLRLSTSNRNKKPTMACFQISGEFITNQARSFWADEEKPAKALKLLLEGCSGMTRDQAMSIILGKAKLIGINDLDMVDDDAALSPNGNELIDEMEMIEKIQQETAEAKDLALDYMDMYYGNTVMVAGPKGPRLIPYRKSTRKGGHFLSPGYATYGTPAAPWDKMNVWIDIDPPPSSRPKPFEAKANAEAEAEAEAQAQAQAKAVNVYDSFPIPTPAYKITAPNGWLSTDGKFYPCEYGQHARLGYAMKIIKGRTDVDWENIMEKAGWMKIQGGKAYLWEKFTAKQRDLVFDWYVERDKPLPYWLEDEKDML